MGFFVVLFVRLYDQNAHSVCVCVCVYDLDVRVGELVFCNARKQLCESVWSKGGILDNVSSSRGFPVW